MFDQLLPTLRAMESSSDGFVESARFKFGLRLPPSITVSELEKIVSEVAGNDSVKMVEGCEAYRAEKIRRWCGRSWRVFVRVAATPCSP